MIGIAAIIIMTDSRNNIAFLRYIPVIALTFFDVLLVLQFVSDSPQSNP
jgi:hypothetical protein